MSRFRPSLAGLASASPSLINISSLAHTSCSGRKSSLNFRARWFFFSFVYVINIQNLFGSKLNTMAGRWLCREARQGLWSLETQAANLKSSPLAWAALIYKEPWAQSGKVFWPFYQYSDTKDPAPLTQLEPNQSISDCNRGPKPKCESEWGCFMRALQLFCPLWMMTLIRC